MFGPDDEDQDAYDEGRDIAESYGDIDEVAGSAHEGDEVEYFAQA